MCGICGYALSLRSTEFTARRTRLGQSVALLQHRGPDAAGTVERAGVGLGHTRLSILDLSDAGRQPMETEDGALAIAYNGECYNFRDIARDLGIVGLRSDSDTEVVLRAFEAEGPACLTRLNGMFAFAVHDRTAGEVWLVRDRLGIKPLYYFLDNERLVFASEIRALLTLLGRTPDCETSGIHEWLFYGNSLGQRTLYRGIRQLLPGHHLRLDLESFKPETSAYWSLQEESAIARQIRRPARDLVATTRKLLEAAVARQLVSDVPVGVFLSGGIDSSAITAFASRHHAGRLATFAAGFGDPSYPDERPKARQVAEHFGTDHHELFIESRDMAQVVEALIDHHGMPFFDAANIPLYLMAQTVSRDIKVVLQGDGGDEVFGGYRRYATLRMLPLLHALADVGRISAGALPASSLRQRILRYCNIFGQNDVGDTIGLLLTAEDLGGEALDVFDASFRKRVATSDPMARYREVRSRFAHLDAGQQMSMVDLSIELPDIFLEKVDRSTMAHGLEVRVPFLDHELVDFVARIPGDRKMPMGRKKWLLKKALRGIVPDFVLDGPKTGFNVPFKHWLMGPLRPHFADHLAAFERTNPRVIQRSTIDRWFEVTDQGKADFSSRLWKMYNFMIWANRFKIRFDA